MAASYRLIQIAFWTHAKYPFDYILFCMHVVVRKCSARSKICVILK